MVFTPVLVWSWSQVTEPNPVLVLSWGSLKRKWRRLLLTFLLFRGIVSQVRATSSTCFMFLWCSEFDVGAQLLSQLSQLLYNGAKFLYSASPFPGFFSSVFCDIMRARDPLFEFDIICFCWGLHFCPMVFSYMLFTVCFIVP